MRNAIQGVRKAVRKTMKTAMQGVKKTMKKAIQ